MVGHAAIKGLDKDLVVLRVVNVEAADEDPTTFELLEGYYPFDCNFPVLANLHCFFELCLNLYDGIDPGSILAKADELLL